MAFANIAGRAGFELTLDKSQLTRGLKQAETEFDTATRGMAASAGRAGDAIGTTRGGLGGVGMVGRLGLFTAAAYTGIQAMNALGSALEANGSKAFTVEGRFRNLGASLLQGDLMSGIEALAKTPKTFEDLGIAAKDAGAAVDGLNAAADAWGGKWVDIARQAQDVAAAYREVAAASQAVLNASVGFRDPSGQLILGGINQIRPQPGR